MEFSLLEESASIAIDLFDRAIWSGRECTWVGATVAELGPRELSVSTPVGIDLYQGAAGIGLFLAQSWAIHKDNRMLATARGAFAHCLATIERTGFRRGGLYTGLTGIGWALFRSGFLIDDPELVEAGQQLCRSVLMSQSQPRLLDVISGHAGEILGQIEVFGCMPSVVQLANELSDDWTESAVSAVQEPLKVLPIPLTGLAHGAAGVGLALLEVARCVSDTALFEQGVKAFEYEEAHFSPICRNWADLREPSYGRGETHARFAAVGWCHGATGIGMARLRALQLYPQRKEWLHQAAAAVMTSRARLARFLEYPDSDSTPCHGVAGLLELLLLAADLAPGLANIEEVQTFWEQLAAGMGRQRIWRHGVPIAGQSPSLLVGMAGTGYSLLRCAHPGVVPSVLMLPWKPTGNGSKLSCPG